jgi:outer membrane protein TolC
MLAAAVSVRSATSDTSDVADSVQLTENYRVFTSRLNELIAQSVANNPALSAAHHRIAQADAAVKASVGFESPRFEVAAMDAQVASFPNPFIDQMRMEYSAEQMLMFPAKIRAMRRANTRVKEMRTVEREVKEREIVYRVKLAFYDVYLVDRQLEINRLSAVLLDDIVASARIRYESGTGMMAELLRAQTERAAIDLKAESLLRKRTEMTVMINALRASPPGTPLGELPEINLPAFEVPLDSLKARSIGNKPDLRAMRAEIAMKKADLAVAKLEWFPDFMIRGSYADIRPMPVTDPMSVEFGTVSQANPDRWSLMLGITIPEVPWTSGRTRAKLRQEQEGINVAQEELADMLNMTGAQLAAMADAVQREFRRMRISSTAVLPQAELALESALAAYKTGSQDFTMLLDAQRMLLMAREEYHMIVMEYLSAQAGLEYAAGVELDAPVK